MIYFLIILVAFIASVIQRVTGFGFGIFAMMFFPYMLESYGEANALSGMLSIILGVAVCITYFKYISWRNLIIPAISGVAASYLAVQFMAGQQDGVLRILLGIFLVLLSIYFMFFSEKIRIKPCWYNGLIAGALSGLLSGLFSMGGPPAVIYFMQSEKDANSYLGTILTYSMIASICNTGIKAAAGFVSAQVLIFWCVGSIGMAAGIYIGKKISNKINAVLLKKVVYGMMAAGGVINIVFSFV